MGEFLRRQDRGVAVTVAERVKPADEPAEGRGLAPVAPAGSRRRAALSQGTRGSAGRAQCHIRTGYIHNGTPEERQAAAAARPAASWSLCRSPVQGATQRAAFTAYSRAVIWWRTAVS